VGAERDDTTPPEPVTLADGVGLVLACGLVFLGGFALVLVANFFNGH
jgi:hypothetical protein